MAIFARKENSLFLPLVPALTGNLGSGQGCPVLSEWFLDLEAQVEGNQTVVIYPGVLSLSKSVFHTVSRSLPAHSYI